MSAARYYFERFLKKVRKIPYPASLKSMHAAFSSLAQNDYYISDDKWLHASELAAYCKWIILEGSDGSHEPIIDLAGAFNVYKKFWAAAEEENEYNDDDKYVALFLLRFVFQQLPFLVIRSEVPQLLARTKTIFSADTKTGEQFETVAGLPLDIFVEQAHELYGLYLNRPVLHTEALRDHFSETKAPYLRKTLAILSADRNKFVSVHNKTKAAAFPEKPYEFNPLLRYPILRHEGDYWVPSPELIIHAATRGLYFYLRDELGALFAQEFAFQFERYVKERLVNHFGKERVITEEEERKAGWTGKTNDVTVLLDELCIMFECKTSGLFFSSKTGASLDDVRTDLRKNLANDKDRSGVFQLYEKTQALRKRAVPTALLDRYRGVKMFFPVLLLYDQVQYANTPQVLYNLLQEPLTGAGIQDFTFQVWHLDELERAFRLVEAEKFPALVRNKFAPENFAHDLTAFLADTFPWGIVRPPLFRPKGNSRARKVLMELISQKSQFREPA